MRKTFVILAIAAIAAAGCNKSLTPQESNTLMETVHAQQYTFKVESVIPAGGRNIQMSPGYDLIVTPKSITAILPYFGRAYFPPMDPNQGGFRFTTQQFTYTSSVNNKGNQEILISPKDIDDVQQLRLDITPSGYASLHVTSFSRQAISYNGYVTMNKKEATLQ